MVMVSIRRGIAASPEKAAARESSSDETLIGRIAGGDQLAMRTLFARHRVVLYRWLLRLVGDETLAEDLLSEAFLSVWRQAHRFEGRSSVSTWLLAIARNKALPNGFVMDDVVDLHGQPVHLEDNHEFVADCCRYSENILSEEAIKKKYRFGDDTWESLGDNEALIEAIAVAALIPTISATSVTALP